MSCRQSWRAPCSTSIACGSSSAIASNDSTAPRGLPGKLMIRHSPRIPQIARESAALRVFCRPVCRINSANPGIWRVTIVDVASGVTSRGPSPVPPVVSTRSTFVVSASAANCARMSASSSGTTDLEITRQPSSPQRDSSALPERSSRVPEETESLTVTMEIRIVLAASEALSSTLRRVGLALGNFLLALVHQSHGFHQDARGRALDGCTRRRRVEINLEFAARPAHRFVHRGLAFHFAQLRILALPPSEKNVACLALAAHGQLASFLAHFDGLHQIENAHLLKPSLNHARTRRCLLQFFELQPVNHFFRAPHEFMHEKRLDDEFFDAVHHWPQLFVQVAAAGKKNERNRPRS